MPHFCLGSLSLVLPLPRRRIPTLFHRCLIVSSPKEFPLPVLPYLSVIDSDLRFSLPRGVPISGDAPQFIGDSVDELASWFMVFVPTEFGLREKGKHRYSKGKCNPLLPH